MASSHLAQGEGNSSTVGPLEEEAESQAGIVAVRFLVEGDVALNNNAVLGRRVR